VLFPALQGALTGLGVGHKAINDVVSAAYERGLFASKLTGAGGGGCVLTIAPPDVPADVRAGFIAAQTAAKRTCFEALIGQSGLRITRGVAGPPSTGKSSAS
jgi:mevalonate kinase